MWSSTKKEAHLHPPSWAYKGQSDAALSEAGTWQRLKCVGSWLSEHHSPHSPRDTCDRGEAVTLSVLRQLCWRLRAAGRSCWPSFSLYSVFHLFKMLLLFPNIWVRAKSNSTNRHTGHRVSAYYCWATRAWEVPHVWNVLKNLCHFLLLSTTLFTFHFSKKNSLSIVMSMSVSIANAIKTFFLAKLWLLQSVSPNKTMKRYVRSKSFCVKHWTSFSNPLLSS